MLLDKIKRSQMQRTGALCGRDGTGKERWERRDRMVGKNSWDLLSQVLRNRWKRSESSRREKRRASKNSCHDRLQSWRANRGDLLCAFHGKGCMTILYPTAVVPKMMDGEGADEGCLRRRWTRGLIEKKLGWIQACQQDRRNGN